MMPPRALQFMGLNVVRFLSVVSLILVFASTILVMVTNIKAVNAFVANKDVDMEDCDYIEGSTVPNQPAGVFWAVVSSLLVLFQTIVLLLSELSWPMFFFDKYFPVLGSKFGLGALGIFQCLISTQILSHHVDDFTLVAAFFLFAIGCINMLLGLIFREYAKDKRSIRSWRAEAKGILPSHADNRPVFVNTTPSYVSNVFAGGDKQQQEHVDYSSWKSTEKAGYGFGRQGEKAAGLRGFILQKPDESLPRYATPPPRSTTSVSRSNSSSSSSSSFSSPYRGSTHSSPHYQQHQRDEEEEIPPVPRMPENQRPHTPPMFKSSNTAI